MHILSGQEEEPAVFGPGNPVRLSILAFVGGVVFLQTQAALPAPWLLALCLLLGVPLVFLQARFTKTGFRVLSFFACATIGFTWAGGMAHWRLVEQLPENWETKEVRLTGVVATLPQRFERGERFVFDVESVDTPGAAVPGRILLSWYRGRNDAEPDEIDADGESGLVHPGERWVFTVRLKRPHGNANPHGFDYEVWLLERGILATGTVATRGEMQRTEAFVRRPAYLVERTRERIRDRFLLVLPEAPFVGVLTALAVGDQRSIPTSQWQVFNRTGVTHLVSISGLHVTMVAALCAALINGLWRRSERLMLFLPAQKAAIAAGWMAAIVYALLAGFEVPAQRTLYMLSVVALAMWTGRNFGSSRILLLAMLAVVLLDPWAVLSTGFWLSFGAVAILLFVGSARIGQDGIAQPGWRAVALRWGGAQWAVTLGSLPLLLLFFQQFSLVSPLANAVAIPVVSFIVTPLALIFSILPWPPLLQFDHWMMSQLMLLLEWLAAWPVWQQPAPPWPAVLLGLVGVVWLLLPRGFPSRWVGLYLLLPALFWPPPRPAAGEAWVDVLDVGQGLAVLVRTSDHALLYDTGPQYGADVNANAGMRVVVPFLRAVGVKQLDTLLVSHRDKDHAGGAQAVRANLPVARVLSSIDDFGGELCAAGQGWDWDGVRFAVLHPEADDYSLKSKKPNNLSCVLRVSSVEGSVLLTADIEARDEKGLVVRASPDLKSDVLLVPHHGGRGSSTPDFIAAVGARETVFSAGYRNAFRHPRPEVLERYADSRIWRTDRDGAVRIGLASGIEVSAWRNVNRRYWHGQ